MAISQATLYNNALFIVFACSGPTPNKNSGIWLFIASFGLAIVFTCWAYIILAVVVYAIAQDSPARATTATEEEDAAIDEDNGADDDPALPCCLMFHLIVTIGRDIGLVGLGIDFWRDCFCLSVRSQLTWILPGC